MEETTAQGYYAYGWERANHQVSLTLDDQDKSDADASFLFSCVHTHPTLSSSSLVSL